MVIEASGQPRALDGAFEAAAHEGRVVVVSWYGRKRAELTLGSDFHRKRLMLKSSQVSNLDPSLSAQVPRPSRPTSSQARRVRLAQGPRASSRFETGTRR